ncbi:MAG: hypothetical protein IJT36_03125 [Alphaproteobacteria bacterium]|nr:hypothetical protein [Alphaproteobacteria bacterium]
MAKLSEHISVFENFQYAINIGYDLYSDDKIKNYIPTSRAIDIIEDIMLSTSDSSTDRARIFTGAYGKGKSHLALVLLAMLYRNDMDLYSNILSVICQTKPELCEYIKQYHKQGKKLLPVVIQGNGMGIRQSLLYGLKKALDEADLIDFMPETYFESAIKTIKNWKKNYPNTYKAFGKKINCSVKEFINELSSFNNSFYKKFTELYPSLTSGSEFNPVLGLDIVSLYSDVSSEIANYGYNGIFVVFDEFSKLLEGNMSKISGEEIKALQDFAEYCNRSQSKQLHILLISHKNMLNYADNLSKAGIDAWKAVSNRFKPIELNTTTTQTYDLMSKVMVYDDEWKRAFVSEKSSDFNACISCWKNESVFADLSDNGIENITYNCYPLSPITSFVLPKISEEIAQNERTLFTFLSSDNQKFSLPKYLSKANADAFALLTPDVVFDYFEPLFKSESYDKPVHKYWKLATTSIEKLSGNNTLKTKIIKTIALIYIINRFDILPPSSEIISKTFSFGKTKSPSIVKALNEMIQAGIIVDVENKNQLRIAEQSNTNISKLISNESEKTKSKYSIETILNDYVSNRVLYPNSYNDDQCVVRYFKVNFISSKNFLDSNNFSDYMPGEEAGIVYAIFDESDLISECIEKIVNIDNNNLVFVIPKEPLINSEYIYKYFAITKYLKICEDPIVFDELSFELSNWSEYLNSLVEDYILPEKDASIYYHNNNTVDIKRKSDLSGMLSDICHETYFNMPVINNEMINKNIVSSQTANSRNKIVDEILQNELKEDLGFEGNGQERTIMRSTLVLPKVLVTENGKTSLNITNCDNQNLNDVFNVIREFILSTSVEGPKSFGELYHLLTSSEHNIGMKKGLIPIYLACVIKAYKKYTVILKGKRELNLNSRLFESINEKPNDYSIFIERWNADKEAYIKSLESLFSVYLRNTESEYSNFDYIVKAIQRWFMQLPQYSIQAKNVFKADNNLTEIDRNTINFIHSFKANEINARELLFDKVFKIFGYEGFNINVLQDIERAKALYDGARPNLINHLIIELKRIFGSERDKEQKSLYSVMLDWYEALDVSAINHLYNGVENSLLELIKSITPDETLFIESFARIVTELRIDDWTESAVRMFVSSAEEFKHIVENTNVNERTHSENGVYKLSFTTVSGEEVVKTFDKTEYSGMADIMYSDVEAMLAEYGDAITKNEKRQILIDIINNILG